MSKCANEQMSKCANVQMCTYADVKLHFIAGKLQRCFIVNKIYFTMLHQVAQRYAERVYYKRALSVAL